MNTRAAWHKFLQYASPWDAIRKLGAPRDRDTLQAVHAPMTRSDHFYGYAWCDRCQAKTGTVQTRNKTNAVHILVCAQCATPREKPMNPIDKAKIQNAIADLHATAAWASGQRWTCRCPEGCGPAARRWYEPENLGPPEVVIRKPTEEEGRFD